MIFLFGKTVGLDGNVDAIVRLINLFTKSIEGPRWLNRQLLLTERAEYHDLNDCDLYQSPLDREQWVRVQAPPIMLSEAVDTASPPVAQVAVWNSSSRPPIYDDSTLLTPYQQYTVDAGLGRIDSIAEAFVGGPQALKVIYTGGLVTPPADGEEYPTVPDDLRLACTMQVATWWQRRKELNLDAVSCPGGGSISLMDPTRMVSHVADVIEKYRCHRAP